MSESPGIIMIEQKGAGAERAVAQDGGDRLMLNEHVKTKGSLE